MASEPNSFKTVAGLWLDPWSVGKSSRHVDTTRRRLEANTLPMLGARPIAEIEAPELVRMAKAIEKRGASDLAKRALETTGQIFRYAIAHGYCKRNPAAEIRPGDILKPTRVGARELRFCGIVNGIRCIERIGIGRGAAFVCHSNCLICSDDRRSIRFQLHATTLVRLSRPSRSNSTCLSA